jgi:hypothetical protein
MKSFKGAVVAVAAIALTAAAQAGAADPAVTSVYTVGSQTVPGVSTGLVLRQGQTVTVTATGAVCPFGDAYCPGPDGSTAVDTTTVFLGGFPLPGAPAWGLVGRVGNGPWVQIGSGPKVLSGTGELVFAVNDDVSMLWDNGGSFTVTVSYGCRPGWGFGDRNHTHCGPPGLTAKIDAPAPSQGDTCRPGWGNGDANHAHCGPPGLAKKDDAAPNGNSQSDAGAQADQSQGNGKNGKGKN